MDTSEIERAKPVEYPLNGGPNGSSKNGLYDPQKLDDAERLLLYAADSGIQIDTANISAVLKAKSTPPDNWSEQTVADLLSALTNLAAKLKPVTAASLERCAIKNEINKVIGSYRRIAYFLAFLIIPYSVATFVTAALSNSIRQDIDNANALAVKLSDEVRPASEGAVKTRNAFLRYGVTEKEVTRDLQQFTATIRAIDARAWQLNVFALKLISAPYNVTKSETDNRPQQVVDRERSKNMFELPADLTDFFATTKDKIEGYQDVRHFAQSVVESTSMIYGALAACFLPVLYALLGACAYLLRSFKEQVRKRTFIPSDANAARFLIAGICGGVVGLFNNFSINQGASISPLAIAFLVGYAADVFFSFLERILQTFTRAKDETTAQTPLPDGKTNPVPG
jgi:hypothetical protein